MTIKVSTTGSDVLLKGLGVRLVDPTTDEDLRDQFDLEEIIHHFDELYNAVIAGDLLLKIETELYGEYEVDPSELTIELLRESQLLADEDERVISAAELLASYTDSLIHPDADGIPVTSTSSITRNVYLASGLIQKWRISPGDRLVLASSAAAGTYTVESVTDQQNFIVEEAIVDTASVGTASLFHPAGATLIGVDNTNLTTISGLNLQEVLENIENNLGPAGADKLVKVSVNDTTSDYLENQLTTASGITLTVLNEGADEQILISQSGLMLIQQHPDLRDLIHFIDEGPADGFASGAFKETLPAGSLFPTSVIWYESAAKLKKIVEKTITRSGGGATNLKPTPIVWKMYDTDGGPTPKWTVSDAISYVGVVEHTRTRTIS